MGERVPMSDKTVRCTACAAEFTHEELENVSACPTCGTDGVPSLIADDVTVRINWHELRILGIWASNYAGGKDIPEKLRRTLLAILDRLEAQHPGKTPLTLSRELRQLGNATGATVEVHTKDGVEVIKGEKPS